MIRTGEDREQGKRGQGAGDRGLAKSTWTTFPHL